MAKARKYRKHDTTSFQRAKLNYNYTLYIGHCPKVLKNMEQRTGLIGKVGCNEILHFKDSKIIAKVVLENTKKEITIYEGMIVIKKIQRLN